MKEGLPRFVTVKNTEDLSSVLVLETREPFFLGIPYGIPKKNEEKVEQMLSDIANGRTGAVKVPGYTIFMCPYGTLTGERMEEGRARDTLMEMAEFYAEQVLSTSIHKNRIYQEGVADDVDERYGGMLKESGALERRKAYRLRKRREREG